MTSQTSSWAKTRRWLIATNKAKNAANNAKPVEGEVISSDSKQDAAAKQADAAPEAKKEEAKKETPRSKAAKVVDESYKGLGGFQKAGIVTSAGGSAVLAAPVHAVVRTFRFAVDTAKCGANHLVGVCEDTAGTYRYVGAKSTMYFDPAAKASFVKAGMDMAAAGQRDTLRTETGFNLDDLEALAKELTAPAPEAQPANA